jgi:uncharacterized protein
VKRKIESQLLAWKNSSFRKPLLLNGARQVGKTFILREFGNENYANIAYFNLESNSAIASFFDEDISPQKLIRYLEASLGERIVPGETFIILDEIQACERAITSLKYFCEEAPEYHIAGAGSLLGVAINRDHASFPVGKVSSMQLFPLDFEEYLWAKEENLLCFEIRHCYETHTAISKALHIKALDLYREYLIVGGMPASINSYLTSGSFIDVSSIKNDIVNNYAADMAKYASLADTLKIRACFDSIPAQLGKDNRKFQYKVVQRGGSSAFFGTSLDWLDQSGITLKCRRIDQGIEPLSIYSDLSSFKIYMSDVGLLIQKAGISIQTILTGDSSSFMGAITENYVAQQLASKGYPLYYWEIQNSQAELDFVVQIENSISAIEVKSSEHVHSRSLTLFIQRYAPARAIRLSTKNFGETETGILCIPLYAAFCI